MNIITKNHTIRLSNNIITCNLPDNHSLELYIDDNNVELFFADNENKHHESIMHCKKENEYDFNSLTLRHLSIPKEYRGEGLGKISLAVMYTILIDKNVKHFKIKFGGGDNSEEFIKNLNFQDNLVHRVNNSVIVGDMEFISDDDWIIKPIPTYKFPTDFFALR